MATTLQIHKPYVLKALSHPLDRPDGPGKHTVGEVYGQVSGPGSKKRKRSELAVAIDGDSVHLYDVSILPSLVPPSVANSLLTRSPRRKPSHPTSSLPRPTSPAPPTRCDGDPLPPRPPLVTPMPRHKIRSRPRRRSSCSRMSLPKLETPLRPLPPTSTVALSPSFTFLLPQYGPRETP